MEYQKQKVQSLFQHCFYFRRIYFRSTTCWLWWYWFTKKWCVYDLP